MSRCHLARIAPHPDLKGCPPVRRRATRGHPSATRRQIVEPQAAPPDQLFPGGEAVERPVIRQGNRFLLQLLHKLVQQREF